MNVEGKYSARRSLAGGAPTFLCYQLAIGPINPHLAFSTGYLLLDTCVFSTAIAMPLFVLLTKHFGLTEAAKELNELSLKVLSKSLH
jgi:hypothetical protein